MKFKDLKIGFALTGSFCTFSKTLPIIKELVKEGASVIPIMSYNAYELDTKFGKAEDFRNQIKEITGKEIIHTIQGAEPIGPKKMTDIMIIAPTTGNTIAKLTNGITDTPVTMAAKSHLRNENPLIIAVSTNDALSGSAQNIGILLNRRNYNKAKVNGIWWNIYYKNNRICFKKRTNRTYNVMNIIKMK